MNVVVLDTDVSSLAFRGRVPEGLRAHLIGMADLVVLPYSANVANTWGALQARAQLRGQPRPANDTWIAACCMTRHLPLAPLNLKDFAPFAEHDGLRLSATN